MKLNIRRDHLCHLLKTKIYNHKFKVKLQVILQRRKIFTNSMRVILPKRKINKILEKVKTKFF
jgi:hypothetical protein